MLHRIRLAMQTNSFEKWGDKFGGAVEVDETYIGGKARRMNAKTRRSHGIDDNPRGHLTEVVGFRQRDGKVAAAVLPVKNKQTLHKEVRKTRKARRYRNH